MDNHKAIYSGNLSTTIAPNLLKPSRYNNAFGKDNQQNHTSSLPEFIRNRHEV